MEPTTVTRFFQQDHERLDGLLRQFHELKRSDSAKAVEAFKEFKFGLQRHIVWEEELLFPRWEQATGITEGPTRVMRIEHRRIGEALEMIHKKVQAGDPESDQEEQQLVALLASHNQKEERILYPAIDQALDERDRSALFTEMRAIPEDRYRVCCPTNPA
ncbi:MAG: hemerythrin domain-containing protein [Nitrospirota bacterium]